MKLKKRMIAMLLTMVCIIALATISVSAATYSKTKSANVTAGPCSAKYSVTATYNTGGNTRWAGKYGVSNIKNSSGYIFLTNGLDVNYNGNSSTMTIKYSSKNINSHTTSAIQRANFYFQFTGSGVQ